jgi:hypothetical protein
MFKRKAMRDFENLIIGIICISLWFVCVVFGVLAIIVEIIDFSWMSIIMIPIVLLWLGSCSLPLIFLFSNEARKSFRQVSRQENYYN